MGKGGYGDEWRDFDPAKRALQVPRANKYAAKKTEIGGQRFDSKREATRWTELQTLQAAGAITDLERQRPFPLVVTRKADGLDILIATWIADFIYRLPSGTLVVEDAKGMRTREYRLKKKLFEATYNLTIVEV